MLGMVKVAEGFRSAGVAVDWDSIKHDAKSGQPTCEEWVDKLAEYCQTNAGGPGGPLISDLANFDNAFKSTKQRMLGGEFVAALTALKIEPPYPIPHIKNGIWKANKIGNKVVDGFCRMLLPNTMGKLKSKDMRPKVIKAEDLLGDCRQLVARTSGLASDHITRALGMLDVRVVMHLLGKSDVLGEEEARLASLEQIAEVANISI